MMKRSHSLGLAALSLTVIGAMGLPVVAHCQDNSETGATSKGISTKKVSVDLESTDLYYAMKLLLQQIKADFTLDPALKGIQVTAHLHDIPFNTALEVILKSSGQPLTYRFENGIYSIIPKIEDQTPDTTVPTDSTDPNQTSSFKVLKIPGNSLNYNSVDIIMALGGRIIQTMHNSGGQGGFGGGGLGGMGGGMGGFGGGMGGFGGGMGGFGGGGMGGFGGGMGGFGGGGMGGFGGGGGYGGGFGGGGGYGGGGRY